MSLSFVQETFHIGQKSPDLSPQFIFYKRGFRLGGKATSGWREVTLSGVGALSLVNAKKDGLTALTLFGGTEQNGTPSPSTPVDIVCNNGAIKVRNKSGLPFGYQAVEYLESRGTHYINTGYIPTSDIVEYGIEVYGTPNNNSALFGAEAPSSPKYTGVPYTVTGITRVYIGGTTALATVDIPNNQWNKYIIKTTSATNGSVILNGEETTFTYSSGIAKTLAIYLFANNQRDSATQLTYIKVKSFYIYDNGILVRNLIPCRRNSDNVLGMYDTVTGNFFTNAGTGNFTAGTDIDDLEIYTDGTTETVEITGKNLFDKNTMDTQEGWYVSNNSTGKIANLPSANRVIVIDCKPNTTYSFWHTEGSGGGRAFDMPTDNIAIGDFATKWTSSPIVAEKNQVITYTTSSTAKKLYILAGREDGTVSRLFEEQLADFMVVEGNVATATEYEPYFNGGSLECPMLLSVGIYQDEFILEN